MICIECVTPVPLKKLFYTHGQEGNCTYCHRHARTIEPQTLFEYIYDRLRENFAQKDDLTAFELGMLYECGSDEITLADVDEVMSDWLDLRDEQYFDALIAGVPDEFKVNDEGHQTHFFGDDGTLETNAYEVKWEEFVAAVHYSHRFFNAKASQFLDSVFSPLVLEDDSVKPQVIRTMNNGDLMYRARLVKNFSEANEVIKNPAAQFGPTPKFLASSQRMTPNGIAALYCALERETCLSEIRSITGDHVVSVALTPVAELQLLDLTVLDQAEPPCLSALEVGFRQALHRKVFLGTLVKKLSRPKARDDELSYLSTQVVFEYLRLRFGQQVDGLVFPSVQTGETGTNVVLFPEASRLAYVLPAASELDKLSDVLTPIEVPVDINNPFLPPTKIMVVHGSIRYHKVTAIETRAREYRHIHDMFMSDEMRKRLNLR